MSNIKLDKVKLDIIDEGTRFLKYNVTGTIEKREIIIDVDTIRQNVLREIRMKNLDYSQEKIDALVEDLVNYVIEKESAEYSDEEE